MGSFLEKMFVNPEITGGAGEEVTPYETFNALCQLLFLLCA
jgi:hypothetical protein